jgi:hypothetical protein
LVVIAAVCKSANRLGAGVLAAVSLSVRGSARRAVMMPGVVSVMVAQMGDLSGFVPVEALDVEGGLQGLADRAGGV